jgi:hypothetical protein
MTRFFFEETSEGYVDPNVVRMPEPANAEPESFTGTYGPPRVKRFQRRFEVRGQDGQTTALVTLRRPLEQAS